MKNQVGEGPSFLGKDDFDIDWETIEEPLSTSKIIDDEVVFDEDGEIVFHQIKINGIILMLILLWNLEILKWIFLFLNYEDD